MATLPVVGYECSGDAAADEQGEGEEDRTLLGFFETLAAAAVGEKDKEGLKMGIKVFVSARMVEGEDRKAAHAEVLSLLKEFWQFKDDLLAAT